MGKSSSTWFGANKALVALAVVTAVASLAGCGGGVSTADGTTSTSTSGGSNSGVPGSSSNPSSSNPTPQNTACTTAPAQFAAVWSSLQGTCIACHSSGGSASTTRLVLTPGNEVGSYNALRNFVNTAGGNTLLSKSIGVSHSGGNIYVNASSQPYQNLQTLIPVMQGSCGGSGGTATQPPVTAASAFWNDVVLLSDRETLQKAAVMFASRNPTDAEYAAVAAGGTMALRATIRSYMAGPAFERFMHETADTHFLTPGVVVFGNDQGGLNAADFVGSPAANLINNPQGTDQNVRNRFQASIRREPVELVKFIVRTDKPWTDVVAGNYTVMNGLIQQSVNGSLQSGATFANAADDNEWQPGAWPLLRLGGMKDNAGVLSTHAWNQRFPFTPTNRNRHKVYIAFKQFLNTDVTNLAARPMDTNSTFLVPTLQDPNCTICHNLIDPIAAGWQAWGQNNRILPVNVNGVNIALPAVYRNTSYPNDANGQEYYKGGRDNWYRDMLPGGYKGTKMPGTDFEVNATALSWLGAQIAGDANFAKGAIGFWYRGVFGREPLKAPLDQTSPNYATQLSAFNAQDAEFNAIAAAFATNRGNGPYNVKDLLVDLVTSRLYRAVGFSNATIATTRAGETYDLGSVNKLTPEHLQRKFGAVLGVTYGPFNNPFVNQGLNYGGFDGNTRVDRSQELQMVAISTIDRALASISCNAVQTDFNRAANTRLLVPLVTMADTPVSNLAAVTENVRHLHKALLKEDLPATHPEIQRSVKLFTDVWNDRATASPVAVSCPLNNNNDPNYTGRAWAVLVNYMAGDAKFLFE